MMNAQMWCLPTHFYKNPQIPISRGKYHHSASGAELTLICCSSSSAVSKLFSKIRQNKSVFKNDYRSFPIHKWLRYCNTSPCCFCFVFVLSFDYWLAGNSAPTAERLAKLYHDISQRTAMEKRKKKGKKRRNTFQTTKDYTC